MQRCDRRSGVVGSRASSEYWTLFSFFGQQTLHNRIFFKKKIWRSKRQKKFLFSFYFISFINLYFPLAPLLLTHSARELKTDPSPIPPSIHDCDAVGGAFDYLGANATTSWRLAIYIGSHPYLRNVAN
jgi:hypothetical protein